MIFGKNLPGVSADKLGVKDFVGITQSRTLSEINAFLYLMQKFKMTAINSGKTILAKSGR